MKNTLNKLFQNQQLTRSEAKGILSRIGRNEFNNSQIASFISVYLMRSISVDEFLGFRDALLELCKDITILNQYDPIDIVGTGGDGKNTFNISTLASFVVAAAGYKVTKHGNYGASSVSGSSTVMEQQGIRFTDKLDKLERSLDKTNIAFIHAPLFNDALKVVAPIRKELGVRTFFNMLGPMANPVKNKKALLGVFNLKMARMYQYVYQNTDMDFAIIHTLSGYDEISLTDDFKIITNVEEAIYSPEIFNVSRYEEKDIFGGETAKDASDIFTAVINNTATKAQKDVVTANAAFAINLINKKLTINDCMQQAREVMENGKLKETFKQFIELNN